MIVQGVSTTGKTLMGLAPAGKAKTKEGNPAESGFASLLATMVSPGAPQAPGLMTIAGDETQAPPPIDGGFLPPSLAGEPGGNPSVQSPPPNFGQMVSAAHQSPVAQAARGLVEDPGPVHGLPVEPSGVALVEQSVNEFLTTPPEDSLAPANPAAGILEPAEDAVSPLVQGPDDGTPTDPVDSAPAEPVNPEVPAGEAQGKNHEKNQNEHRNNLDLTRGLERAAQVSSAGEHRPVDSPNAEKFPIPAATMAPVDAGSISPPDEPRLPSALESLRAERHQPAQLMDAISRSLANTRDGQYTVTLRLHPEQLGEVRLQLQLSGREVHTVMEVANPVARQALESRGDQLRQNLSQAGLTLSGFEVSTGQNHQSARERREAFENQLLSQTQRGARRTEQVAANPVGAIERIRNAARQRSRLDTMA